LREHQRYMRHILTPLRAKPAHTDPSVLADIPPLSTSSPLEMPAAMVVVIVIVVKAV